MTSGLNQPEQSPGLPVLSRFLTPLPESIVAHCIRTYSHSDELVVNPFCRSLVVAAQGARLGRRAILSEANPLTAFVIRTSLELPSEKELAAGFQRIGEAYKGDAPLRTHLRQLYATTCPHCGQGATASHFVWSRQLDRPVAKSYHCSTCRQDRTEPVDDHDMELQRGIEDRGFHFWSIVDRLATGEDETRALATRLLGLYTPRNLYALATLVAKFDALFDSPSALNAFRLVAVECLDRCSRLTPAGKRPASRTSLRPPAQYLELNVWDAFEEAYRSVLIFRERVEEAAAAMRVVDDLEEVAPRLTTLWEAAARRPGMPVMVRRSGALRLGEDLPAASTALVMADPPPVAQGIYFQLAWMWTGWLLGKEAATFFQPEALLHPKRADDCEWYLQAMTATFSSLSKALVPNGRVALSLEETDTARIRALSLALCGLGLAMERLDYQPLESADPLGAAAFGGTPGRYLLVFRKDLEAASADAPVDASSLAARIRGSALQAMRETLAQRAQPSPFVWLNNAICLRLAAEHMLEDLMRVKADGFSPLVCLEEEVRAAADKGLQSDLVQITTEPSKPGAPAEDGGEQADGPTAEGADGAGRPRVSWWLSRPRVDAAPLLDQVEETTYNMLGMTSAFTPDQINRAIDDLFQGPRTPEPGLVHAVLESYSVPVADGQRMLRPEDRLEPRVQEHLGLVCLLTDLGHRFGFGVWISREEQKRLTPQGPVRGLLSVEERYVCPVRPGRRSGGVADADVIWYGQDGEMWAFEVEWTALLQAPLVTRRSELPGLRRFLVVPEERLELIQFKVARNVLWKQAIARDGWEYIKSAHLRRFSADELPLERFGEIVGLEPAAEKHGLQLTMW